MEKLVCGLDKEIYVTLFAVYHYRIFRLNLNYIAKYLLQNHYLFYYCSTILKNYELYMLKVFQIFEVMNNFQNSTYRL